MFENLLNKQKQRSYKKDSNKRSNNHIPSTQHLTPEQVARLMLKCPELRLSDNPANIEIAQLLTGMPEDPYMQELFQLIERDGIANTIAADDTFLGNYPSGRVIVTPDMVVCGVMPTGDPIVFEYNRLFCNMGVFGRTGSGKTSWLYLLLKQLLKRDSMKTDKDNILIVVFQQKDEYNHWAADPELKNMVLPLSDNDFKISPFQSTKGLSQKHHVHAFFDDFSRSYGRIYAQRLGEDVALKRLKTLPKELHLPWSLYMEALDKFRPGHGNVESRYRESMQYASKDLKNCFGDIFDYYQSDMLDCIYDWSGLVSITVEVPVAASTTFVTIIIRHLYNQSKCIFESGGTPKPIIFIIEDATVLTDEKELGGATSPLVQMSFVSRRYNQGFIFVGHNISTSFSKKLLSNLESIAIFGISEPARVIQDLLCCSANQAQVAQVLRPGEFLTILPSFHPHAVYGQYPYVTPPRRLDESERQDIVGPFLDKVRAIKYIDRGLPAVTVISVNSSDAMKTYRLDSKELQLLVLAGTGKRLTKTKIYNQLNLSRRDGKKVLDKLEKKAMVRSWTFSRVGIPEVLDLGWKILSEKGFGRRESKSGGSFPHEVGLDLINESEKKKGNVVRFEVDLFKKRLDVESMDKTTGQRIFFNVGVSDYVREANNIVEILKIPVVRNNKFVFVAINAKFAKKVRSILREKDTTRNLLRQVEIKTIADYVNV